MSERITRRGFLKLASVAAATTAALTGCGPIIAATLTPAPVAENTPSFTPEPTSTTAPSKTPEPSSTPEKSFRSSRNPESPNIERVTLADIQSGDLARWALSLHESNKVISKDPSKLNYKYEDMLSTGTMLLGNDRTDKPGWNAKNSTFLCLFRINPSEWGIQGKNDALLLVSVMQDKNDRRVIHFGLDSEQSVVFHNSYGALNDPVNEISFLVMLKADTTAILIKKGAKPGGPDDLRDLTKGDIFYSAQGTTLEEVDRIIQSVSDTDVFSDEAVQLLNHTVFFGIPGSRTFEK
jgi:hypothetical protein